MADVDLTVTIPDAYVIKVLNALQATADRDLMLGAFNSDSPIEWGFKISGQQGGETSKDFGERYIKEFLLAVIRMVEFAQDKNRYDAEIQAVTPPTQDVGDGTIL